MHNERDQWQNRFIKEDKEEMEIRPKIKKSIDLKKRFISSNFNIDTPSNS